MEEIMRTMRAVMTEIAEGKVAGIVVITSPAPETYEIKFAGNNPCSLVTGCRHAQDVIVRAISRKEEPVKGDDPPAKLLS